MKPSRDDDSKSTGNQGEGDREAARRFNEAQKRFAEAGTVVEDAARGAAPRDQQQADDLLEAEQRGRDKARGEDPTVPGANAKRQHDG